MIDFLMIATRSTKRGAIEIYPKFIIKKSNDLMIRGGDFYAIWLEDKGLWSTDEQDALQLIDSELDKYLEENRQNFESNVKVLHMWDAENRMIDSWHRYCQRDMRDSFHMLDEKLIFSNTKASKRDYSSKRLEYPLEPGETPAYDRLMSVLYSEEERHKIEWAIGSVVSGESKKLQKFMVLYGAAGTGKSTVLNIIQQLFEGYYSVFDAKALGSANSAFALEAFRANPLVAIQHDGDLSRIEDNTRLNSLVSHELMTVNEKFKSTYSNRFKCFLFMGTNKPVKITDAKSGLIRRLIDVAPSGNRLSQGEYKTVTKQIAFELGPIAYHCQEVYLADPTAYDGYIPIAMLGASNDFYNFMQDSYLVFKKEDGVTLKAAWEMYRTYCDDARVTYPLPQRIFKEELKSYFEEYRDRFNLEDGSRVRSYYTGFKTEKFEDQSKKKKEKKEGNASWLELKEGKSIFDEECAECPAQYATDNETPMQKWSEVQSKLLDLNTSELHYVQLPRNHIVIDFDLTDKDGNKCLKQNIEAASKWPPTYAELSKGGEGLHLHYIYNGDPSKLSLVYDDHIEVKVPSGNSSLRRRLSKCNDLPVATISSGLPLKGDGKMVNFDTIKNEKGLRTLIKKNLNKEIMSATKPSIDFIYKDLENAYASGIPYDVTDMRNAVLAFAANSSNQSDYCLRLVNKMRFKSDDISDGVKNDEAYLVFYDVEVFPNLFLVNWKLEGEGRPVVRMVNPTSAEIEELMRFRLVGFNCRRYDNHILYARYIGYTNEQLYTLSSRIINGSPNCMFGEAYNLSYTDVYDFSSEKKSLKKFEIELGIHHQELGLPWDQPVPEDMWIKVAEYCDNDVLATEAVFNARKADFTARQILADLAGMTVNDTTNTLTTRIIFGKDRTPQSQFNYRDMGEVTKGTSQITVSETDVLYDGFGDEFTLFDEKRRPVFPGYKFERGKSTYRGEEVGEGGYVYAEPGMHGNVAIQDIASMHPSSIVAEQLFGKYTKNFQDILDIRIAIKHEDFDKAKKMMGGKLAKYLDDKDSAKSLSQALKIAINSVYGLTSAGFENPFKDPRNTDNIVAKRGALFMINLKHAVQQKGFKVVHIKTDSIKIADATPEIIQFVADYGDQYGYTFEHEGTYERMCLVNKAVYIAKYATVEQCVKLYGEEYVNRSRDILKDNKKAPGEWTATGTQFQVPYVFKTLFSKKDICFEDMCETKSVTSALYLDMNEGLPDVSAEQKELNKLIKMIDDPKRLRENMDKECERVEELGKYIDEKSHNYVFIGKVGLFCPIKPGCGGGELLRETATKSGKKGYASATGAADFRWLEAEMVKTLKKEKDIDRSYYDRMVDEAVKSISEYTDFEWFASKDPYIPKVADDDSPPWYETDPFKAKK